MAEKQQLASVELKSTKNTPIKADKPNKSDSRREKAGNKKRNGQQQEQLQVKKQQGPKNVPHRDQFHRLSYLYQAANLVALDKSTSPLARMYAQTVKTTAKKSVLRL